MKSRGLWAAVLMTILFVGWVAWISRQPQLSAPSAPAQSQYSATPAIAASQAPGNTLAPPSGTPAPAPPGTALPAAPGPAATSGFSPIPSIPPPPTATAAQPGWRAQGMVELEKVHRMVGSYHTLYGQNPVGTNAEIMKSLMGGNPRGAMLGPPPGQSLNAKGELIDPWGTPYFFHQMSGDDMQIISAGPDKIMGTADDLIIP